MFARITPNYTLPCIRCGTTENVSKYVVEDRISTSKKRYTRVSSRVAGIPVCASCQEIFTKWKRGHYSTMERSSYTDYLWGFGCGTFIAVAGIIQNLWFGLAVFGIMGLVLLWILHDRLAKRQIDSPFRYVKFRVWERVFVRPQGKGNWIFYKDWLESHGAGDYYYS